MGNGGRRKGCHGLNFQVKEGSSCVIFSTASKQQLLDLAYGF